MNEELEYTIKQQQTTINNNAERVAKLILHMQSHINNGAYVAAARMLDTCNLSNDIENLVTALARYETLLQVRHMVEKQENDAPLELKYSDYDDTYISDYTEDEQ